jgi:hypothetical protein
MRQLGGVGGRHRGIGRLVVVGALGAALAVSAQAAPERAAACPAPKPLPAGTKKPPPGANATELARFLLALPQRKPCDVSTFTSTFAASPPQFTRPAPGLYPQGKPMRPAAGAASSEEQIRSRLASILAGVPTRGVALRRFDSPALKAKLPDPTLRAALLSLHGTLAEPLVEYYLSRTYVVTQFSVVARQKTIASATGSGIIFSERYEREHFALLAAVFAHEILHHDIGAAATEEVLLHAVASAVHMQLLDRHPRLATLGTELARFMNDEVLLFVNSRVPGSSKSAIVVPNGKGTAPGSVQSRRDLYSHGEDFSTLGNPPGAGDDDAAPEVFRSLLRALLVPGTAIPKRVTYSKKTALLFSRMNDTWLSPVARLRVSVLLGLVSMEEITAYTGSSRAKAIATFRLGPILAARG